MSDKNSTEHSAKHFRGRKAIVAGAALTLLIAAALVVQHRESVANFINVAHERIQERAYLNDDFGGDPPPSIGSAFTPVLW
jgi:hypothetical protein